MDNHEELDYEVPAAAPQDVDEEERDEDFEEEEIHRGRTVRVRRSARLKSRGKKTLKGDSMGQGVKNGAKTQEKWPLGVPGPSDRNSEDIDNTEYVIENIIDHKVIKGMLMLLFKWYGYPMSENTW